MQVRRHFAFAILWGATCGWAQNSSPAPVWWAKYQYLSQHAADAAPAKTASLVVGSNVDVSNECGPQSETFITLNPAAPAVLAAGSNENTIGLNRSFDGGATFGTPGVVAGKSLPFAIAIPAISFRGALVYPACDADRSSGPHRGRLYCSWMDLTHNGTTDIFAAFSDDHGTTWSAPDPVTDHLTIAVDRFYPWLSVDPVTGVVNISFYDTRNDTTGQRFMTDVYFTHSRDGVAWLSPNVRVSSVSSNEHDCNGLFPCSAIDYGNQYGDYEGLVSFGGVSHPIWTDSRRQQSSLAGCRTNQAMEEVFTATVR